MDITFITGNKQKAEYLEKWLGLPVAHQSVDLEEIQSLNLHDVVAAKAQAAHSVIRKPVLVEDVSLRFTAMGRLPGTFIKWFLEEMTQEELCRLVDGLPERGAEAAIVYGLYDGKELLTFEATQKGSIADHPKGHNGFGWNHIFIPEGHDLTYAEMDEAMFKEWNIRAHAIAKLRDYLKSR